VVHFLNDVRDMVEVCVCVTCVCVCVCRFEGEAVGYLKSEMERSGVPSPFGCPCIFVLFITVSILFIAALQVPFTTALPAHSIVQRAHLQISQLPSLLYTCISLRVRVCLPPPRCAIL
jgi:hypothetical protein